MKAVIVDDIKQARKALHHDLIDYCEGVQVIGEAGDVESAVRLINEENPNLVFLDIDLGNGTTGFDILEQLSAKPKVIFTTAFDHFAIKAFKFGAIDYLLKPIDEEELVKAVEKVQQMTSVQIETGKEILSTQVIDKVIVNHQEEMVILPIKDILSCEASNNYTIFHLSDRTVISSETLKHYESLFEQNDFYRCHHSHLVNLAHIKSVIKKDGGYIILSNDKEIPVSTRKREALNKKIKEQYLN